MVRPIITYGYVFMEVLPKTDLKISKHSKRNFYVGLLGRLVMSALMSSIVTLKLHKFSGKKIEVMSHRCIPYAMNAELNFIRQYNTRVGMGNKRARAILSLDDNFVSCSKISRRNPSGVT